MKPKYSKDLPIRCEYPYSVTYMYLSPTEDRVRLSVSKTKKHGIIPQEGDQQVFATLEKAREYAYNHGYIVYYEEKQK